MNKLLKKSKFIDNIIQDIIEILEGLTGQTFSVKFDKILSQRSLSDTQVMMNFSYGNTGLNIITSVDMSTALSDLMIGGEGVTRDKIHPEDLETIKEIYLNILQTFNPKESKENNIYFKFQNIQVKDKRIIFKKNDIVLNFDIELPLCSSSFYFIVNQKFLEILTENNVNNIQNINNNYFKKEKDINNITKYSNLDLLKKMNILIRVEIGQKEFLLKDILNKKIGDILELNQSSQEPLNIFVENTLIAKGEIVIIDGNYGIQITDLLKNNFLEE